MKEPVPNDDYRRCVGIMLINRKGQVFVGSRVERNFRNAWQMPQGGIDRGETPKQAALRELHEEVGTNKAEVLAEHPAWLRYDLPPELSRRTWRGKFRGQTQKWFAMRFLGEDRDIRLDAHHQEFEAWKWVAMAELPRLIVPFKRAVYEAVVEEFKHLAKPG
jgi:putative (di)nucleoside polyphosphate hydrolase